MPPYLRLVEASACWNASKMIFCFSSGMPMPVSVTSNATTAGAWLSTGCSALQPPSAAVDIEADAALGGELERVRQQVLEHLLQPLGVGGDAAAEIGIDVDFERQLPRFRLVAERPRHHVEQVGEEHLLGVDRDGAGLDLGQIENIADEVEQVGAGAVDGAGELDLLGRSGCLPDCR